jgi:radical SAM superfamily enzyme YgiQ (UPF0313 family)
LLKPRYVFASHHPVQFTGAERALPLSLAYLAAVLEREGYQVRVVDYQIERSSPEQILRQFRPDVVGITSYSKEFPHAKVLIRAVKQYRDDLPVILGGPHINAYKEKIFAQTDLADYLVLHEGEQTATKLVQCLARGAEPSKVKGIICRDDEGKVATSGPREFIKDLDSLPFMALEHFQVDKYYPPAGTFRRLPSVTMITSRGCPFPCIFCNTDLFGKGIRLRSAVNVLNEIEEIVKRYDVREINFCDETLTVNRDRMIAICEGILERNLNIGWKCSTRVDYVDFELLKLMKRSGCFYIGYGVESGVQETLDRLQKGITLAQIRRAFTNTRKAGITSMAYFMMNIPGETEQDIEQTIRFSREIQPDFLNFELVKPYAGTRLREIIEKSPDIRINRELWAQWENYSAGNHLFYVQPGVSERYLRDAYRRAVRDFYISPTFILKAVKQVRSLKQLASYFKYFTQIRKIKLVKNQ